MLQCSKNVKKECLLFRYGTSGASQGGSSKTLGCVNLLRPLIKMLKIKLCFIPTV